MTVYVDDMRRRRRIGNVAGVWSHLFADSQAELIDFAVGKLGMRRCWIQHPGTHREHFDVTDANRRRAIQLGAVPIAYPRGTGELLARRRGAT